MLAEIAKSLYSGKQGSGRKLKPKKTKLLVDTYERNRQFKPIATLGAFSKLPKNIQSYIHDKKQCSQISELDKCVIAEILLKLADGQQKDAVVSLNGQGREILNDICARRPLSSKQARMFNLGTIFTTQERQIVLG